MAQGFATGNPSVFLNSAVCGGRLTASSGVPVPTTDQTSITTIYFTPYVSNTIGLYDGSSAWNIRSFSEISISVPATTSTMYDVFAYDNSGSVACETLAWTNDTTRATGISLQNGVYVKSGDSTRRYIGSLRTTTVSGQTEDSATKRYIWNYYNRVERPLIRMETTANWTYSTAAWRQANNSTSNQVDVVVGVLEDRLYICVTAEVGSSTGTTRACATGMGIDGTGSSSATQFSYVIPTSVCFPNGTAIYNNLPTTVGRHYYTWLEYGGGADTQTWSGVGTPPNVKYGIIGYVKG